MAENFAGPYEIEFLLSGWATPARTHVLRFNVIVVGDPAAGTSPTLIDVQKMSGATAKLDVVANQLWSFLRTGYHTSISAISYTLWKYVTGTSAKDFVSAGSLTTPTGSSSTSPSVAGQTTLTFRSSLGGIMKIVLLEASLTGDNQVVLVPNIAGTAPQRIASYIMSGDNVAIARDDSYPAAPLRDSRGQNERIWREVFR